MAETIKLERLSVLPYTVNYPLANGGVQTINWKGASLKARSIQEVSQEVFDWLRDETCTITRKSLVIVDDKALQKEVEDFMTEEEVNIVPVKLEDMIKLFDSKTTTKAFEKALAKYSDAQLEEIVTIIKDKKYAGKFDSASKRKIIANRLNLPTDILFAEAE